MVERRVVWRWRWGCREWKEVGGAAVPTRPRGASRTLCTPSLGESAVGDALRALSPASTTSFYLCSILFLFRARDHAVHDSCAPSTRCPYITRPLFTRVTHPAHYLPPSLSRPDVFKIIFEWEVVRGALQGAFQSESIARIVYLVVVIQVSCSTLTPSDRTRCLRSHTHRAHFFSIESFYQ